MSLRPRFIDPGIWMDDKMLELDPETRLIFIGLITLTDDYGRIKIEGSLRLSLGFGPNYSKLGQSLLKIFGCKLYLPYQVGESTYAWCPNWDHYQHPKYKAISHLPSYESGTKPTIWPKFFQIGIEERSGSGVEGSKDTPPIPPLPFEEIISDLNARAGTTFRHTSEATRKAIRARMAEGHTLEDFRRVHKKQCEAWLGTDMAHYLNPQTLYRPSKFEKYLNGKPAQAKVGPGGVAPGLEQDDSQYGF